MKYLLCLLASFLAISVYSQPTLPVVRANSRNVAVNDGGYLERNAWTLAPEAKPDVYTSTRSLKSKWVTFITDIDSIRVRVKPGTVYDFVILLQGKDSCFTQIRSAVSEESWKAKRGFRRDTIPFTLSDVDAIQVVAVVNGTDTLNLHLDLGSLDFRLTREAILQKTHLMGNQPDALSGKAKPDYNNMMEVKEIQIGMLSWKNPHVQAANNAASGTDGRFGWRVWDGKVIEIDYDSSYIVVHDRLPRIPSSFAKSDIRFIQSLLCIQASIEIAKQRYEGNFLMDTGSNLSMVLDEQWMHNMQVPQNLNVIKQLTFSDGAGNKYETHIVSVPAVTINGWRLENIPASQLSGSSPVGFEMNYFGNDLLKRFNAIVDLRTDHIYLKANHLINLPYKNGAP